MRASHNAACERACDDREVRVSVLIVDDHEEFRNSARALLQADGYAVVGEARDGAEAIAEAERLRPEIVLLDVQLPGIDGFAVAERLASWAHPPAVVLISSRDARSYGPRLARAPARGFLKRRISDAIYARLRADARHAASSANEGPGGQPGNDSDSSAAGSHPERQLFGPATPGPSSSLRPATPASRTMPPEPRSKKIRRSP
jgi:DNA-binding NarL/FixJ family response regulator